MGLLLTMPKTGSTTAGARRQRPSALVLLGVAILGTCSLAPVWVIAQEAAASNPTANNPEVAKDDAAAQLASRIDQLTEQLDAPKFRDREQASSELLRIGQAAIPELKQLWNADSSLESRLRAEALISAIEDESFAELSTSFLLDADPQADYDLPAWDEFREIVGSSRTSKLLFLDMVRQQRPLVMKIEELVSKNTSLAKLGAETSAATSVAARLAQRKAAEAVSNLATTVAYEIQQKQMALQEPKIGDFVALLLSAAVVDNAAPVAVSETLYSSYHRQIAQYMRKQGYGNCLRKLMSRWVPKTHEAIAGGVLAVSLEYDIAAGVAVARRQLRSNTDTEVKKYALLCLVRFGNEADLPQIVPFLNDESLVHSLAEDQLISFGEPSPIDVSDVPPPGVAKQETPDRQFYTVQINDLALATAMLLSGDDPQRVYPHFQSAERFGFDTRSLATPADDPKIRLERIQTWIAERLPAEANG